MKTLQRFTRRVILPLTAVAVFGLVSLVASADTVNAVWNSAADVPVTASGYSAAGNTANFTLNFAPAPGTELTVVKNTGLGFIDGTFDNLARGQRVTLTFGGISYDFVANYNGGSGNDLVLIWADTRAFGWGDDGWGELGDNNGGQSLVPAPANTAPGVSALYGQTVVAISAGESHSLALCSDGSVAAYGFNGNGELGNNGVMDRHVPVAVNTSFGVSALYDKKVVAIAAGALQSLALCGDGTVAAWGDNRYGELGDNTTTQRYAPVAVNRAAGVSALYGKTVVAIAAGEEYSLALCSDGTVAAWGLNNWGQLGDGQASGSQSLVPVAVNTSYGVSALYGKTVVAIAAGFLHSVALCSDGTVAAWGDNRWGQLGDGQASGASSPVPVAVNTNQCCSALFGKAVVAVAAGYGHCLALCSDGSVAAWGYNYHGELGNGDVNTLPPNGETIPKPVTRASGVSALYGKTVVNIAAVGENSLALCSDGTLAGWGFNSNGELGDNTTTLRPAPVAADRSSLGVGGCLTRVAGGALAIHALGLVAEPLPPCRLQVQRGAGTLTLEWPANYASFIPQANPWVANPTGWSDLADTPVRSGATCTVTLPGTNAVRFFRLRSP